MTLEQINALSLEDQTTFNIILYRVVDFSALDTGDIPYEFRTIEGTLYDRLLLNPKVEKPLLSVFESELAVYKQEEIDRENARLSEIARVKDITDRWNAMKDIRLAFVDLGEPISNLAIELKRIINENDIAKLEAVEAAYVASSVKIENRKRRQSMSDLGEIVEDACVAVFKLISGYNMSRSLTKEQKDQMTADFAPILEALKNKRPGVAKNLILAATPDGILITEEIKQDILDELAEFGI